MAIPQLEADFEVAEERVSFTLHGAGSAREPTLSSIDGETPHGSRSWLGRQPSYTRVSSSSPRNEALARRQACCWRQVPIVLGLLAVALVTYVLVNPKLHRSSGLQVSTSRTSGMMVAREAGHHPAPMVESDGDADDDQASEQDSDADGQRGHQRPGAQEGDEDDNDGHHRRHHGGADDGDDHHGGDDDEDSAPASQNLLQQAEGFFGGFGGWLGWATGEAAVALHIVTVTATTTTATSTSTGTTTSSTATSTTSSTLTTTFTTTTTVLATLFCWEVVRPEGYEPALIRGQWDNKASIFDCEEYTLLSNGGIVQVGSVTSKEIILPKNESLLSLGNLSKPGTTTTSWLNTRLFISAWDMILKDGRWWQHEWTVKVDPDAVFFPHRLKVKLYSYYTAGTFNGPALFVANCDRSWNGEPWSLKLFGSIEVVSRNALGMYNARNEDCIEELDWEGWGEDFFMQSCLKMLGVGVVNGVGYLADNRCHYAPCTDTSKVAFHDYKDVQRYFDCWGQSHEKEKAEEQARQEQLKREMDALLR